MVTLGSLGPVLWLFPFFKKIPYLNENYLRFGAFVGTCLKDRLEVSCHRTSKNRNWRFLTLSHQNGPDRPDIFSWILKDFLKGPQTKQDHLNLQADASLLVIAA